MVLEAGIEPAYPHGQQILSLSRIPDFATRAIYDKLIILNDFFTKLLKALRVDK